MKAVVVREFIDIEGGMTRKIGDQFTCTKDRFAAINSAGFGRLVDEIGPEERKPRGRKSDDGEK